jgi:mRNA interferase HigB
LSQNFPFWENEGILVLLVGLLKLNEFKKKHADVRGPVDAWCLEVQAADWKSPQCIKNRYRSADFLADNKVIFDINGNRYRLLVKVNFERSIVVVEWIGTHSDYAKKKL